MSPLQSALTALLIVLILLLVVVVFVPAVLERMSRANRSQREERAVELASLRRDARRLELELQPFDQTRSAVYRQATTAAGESVAALSAQLDTLSHTLDGLHCPQVFGYLFPIQHFFVAPRDVGVIVSDANRLRQARAESAAAAQTAAAARAALDTLTALPQRLSAERTALARRLTELEGVAGRERDAGIIALDDLTRDSGRIHAQLARYQQLAVRDAPVGDLDNAAQALEAATTALDEAEARATELARQRAALDERIDQATTELDAIQAAGKSGAGGDGTPEKVRPLLLRAAALLNESAPDHRARREFNAAAADVAAATRLIAVARDLIVAGRNTRVLVSRDDGAALHPAIAALREELSGLVDRLGQEAMSDEGVGALAGRSAQVRARAEALTRQQDEAIAALEEEALATREQLEHSWEAANRLLPLADDDPLARRCRRLLDDFQAAQRRPAEMEKFRQDVAAFEGVLEPWVTRVQATRARIGRLRQRLPDVIDAALLAARPWSSLSESVVFIQQRAADFETAQARFAAVAYRRQAESLMEQIEAIEQDVEERAAQIDDWAGRLNFLEDDAKQIVELAGADVAAFPADHPDRVRWDKAMKLIDHHIRSAHAAGRYEDASVALLRAADVANKLAL